MVMEQREPQASWIVRAESLRESLGCLQSGHSVAEPDLQILVATGAHFSIMGQHERALEFLTLLCNLRPAHQGYLGALAVTLVHLGRPDQALGIYRRLDVLDPCNPLHSLSIAECLIRLQRMPEALHLLEVVIDFCGELETLLEVRQRAQALYDVIGSTHDTCH